MTVALCITGVVVGLLAVEAVLTRIVGRNTGRTSPGIEKAREQCQGCLRDIAACSCPMRWTRKGRG